MKSKQKISDVVSSIIKSADTNENAVRFNSYKEHLKNRGLLREDSYDWKTNNPKDKTEVELIGKSSKNYLINHN